MRRLELGIGLSAALHGGLVVWALAAKPPRAALPQADPVTIEVVDIVAPPPPPVDDSLQVALLAPDTATPTSAPPLPGEVVPPPVASAATSHHAATAITTNQNPGPGEVTAPTGTGTGTVPDPNAHGPAKPGVLTMRTGPDLSINHSYEGAYDMPAGTPPPGPPPPSGYLQESGGGTHKAGEGTFTVNVHQDGSVDIEDRPNVGGGAARQTGPGPTDERLNNYNAVDPGAAVDGGGATGSAPVGGTVAHFDVTDAIMRRHGQDPYASQKLKVLDATRDERVEIGERYKEKQLQHTPQIVAKNLARMFATVKDAAGQKDALFEMWDESVETGDDSTVEAGQAARKLVVAAIRSHYPNGSVNAYTVDELAAYNKRRSSKARFSPYE